MILKHKLKNKIPPKYRMILGTKYHNFLSFFKLKVKVENNEKLIIVVASPHKVGSTWIYNILRSLTRFYDIFPPLKLFNEYRKVKIPLDDLMPYFDSLSNGKGYLFKSHSLPPKTNSKHVKFITVIRDPRDVFVSLANYVSHLPVELGGRGKEFANLSTEEKVSILIENSDNLYNLFYTWIHYDHCLILKYEDLKFDIEKCVRQVVTYCNMNVSDQRILKSIDDNDFAKVTGRKSGQEKNSSFFRKGIVGDWKNIFNDKLQQKLYENEGGRWKELIVDLGYEL